MKNYSWLLIIPFIGFLFLAIWGFTRIAIWPTWNLSASGQIGDTIGGITAPFINLLGAILVYLSFKQQQEANRIQSKALKAETDRTTTLNKFNQLTNLMISTENKIKEFKVKFGTSISRKEYKGSDAFLKIITHFTPSHNDDMLYDAKDIIPAYINLLKICIFIIDGIESYKESDDLSRDILQISYVTMITPLEPHLENMRDVTKSKQDAHAKAVVNHVETLIEKNQFVKMTTTQFFN